MAAIHLKEETFEAEVLKSDIPVLVDFWAEWCGPCKAIAPIVDEVADEFAGKVKVAKLDVDAAQELAAKYNVMSIPTMVIFKGGEPVDQIVGAVPKDQIIEKINANIG